MLRGGADTESDGESDDEINSITTGQAKAQPLSQRVIQ